MFQPVEHLIPSQYDLMPPTLEAIYELVGMSREGVHYTRINEWITDGMPPRLVGYIKPTGSRPLLEGRLNSARSLLKKEGLVQNGKRRDGSNIQGRWALTPTVNSLRDQQLRSGGSITASSTSETQSLARRQPQGLAHLGDMTPWINVLLESNREFSLKLTYGDVHFELNVK